MSIGSKYVPNEGPTDAKILCVGEAPGVDEVADERPFVGTSGTLLRETLEAAGAGSVRFANLCHYRPENNKFPLLLRSKELYAGIAELENEIREFRPTVIAALGNWPMYYLTGKHGKKGIGTGIGKWRGSILPCSISGCGDIKVVPTFHPAFISRNRSAFPIFKTDICRTVTDSIFSDFRYPTRKIEVAWNKDDVSHWTEYLSSCERLSCDIETIKGVPTAVLCHGFSPTPELSVVFPHSSTDFFRFDALLKIYQSSAKKIFHNGCGFDLIALKLCGIDVENYWWDTMIGQHVMWCELPRSLEYLTSIYTRQPYYKTAGRAEIPEDEKGWSHKFDRNELYNYNGTDTSVTAEIQLIQEKEIDSNKNWRKKFDFEHRLVPGTIRLSMAGLPIDLDRRETIKRALETKWAINQFALDHLTGYKTNVNSPKAMARILFDKDKLGLPVRRDHKTGNLTTDEDAVVSLIGYCKDYMSKLKPGGNAIEYWKVRYECLKAVLLIRGIRKLLSSYINIKISDDGRCRSTYKIPATDTMRYAAAQFIDRTGTNAQTFPREVLELKTYEDIPQLKDMLKYIFAEEQQDIADSNEEPEQSEDGEDSGAVDDIRTEGLPSS